MKLMKIIKNIVRIITLVPLSLYLIYCVYFFIFNFNTKTYIDCGNVVSKSSDEVAIKHGTRTELYLNVQFENSGFKSVECGPTTYFSKKKGDNVCFEFNEEISNWQLFNIMIGYFVIVAICIVLLYYFVLYLLPESWKQ